VPEVDQLPVTEFYCGEAIFSEKKVQHSRKHRFFEELERRHQKESFIQKLWEQGYLKCDLTR